MLRDLQSKLTGRIQYAVDEKTYQSLVANGNIKKYTIIQEHIAKKVIPAELIVKKTISEKKKIKNTEDTTLNEQ